ncbi:hypothetical protein IFM89_013808 [Coptis chinensis]|uniref:Uncharacterized protein n=1 Tax=Coptis chinensis TaxID=261450 RepID=A0A835HJP3_9MAGN|nr:hypothetical protein IFM89_013808 [Coptis chinensis]
MGSYDQKPTYGYAYGYGYWNGYEVASQFEEASSTATATPYQVFSQEQKQDSNYMPFQTAQINSGGEYAPRPWEDLHSDYNGDSTNEDSEIGILLEFLDDLYFESHDLFKKVVSELQEKYLSKKSNKKEEKDARAKAFSKFIKKLPRRLHKKKLNETRAQTMRRSLSLGSPRTPKSGDDDQSTLKLFRFKVKTLHLGGSVIRPPVEQGAPKFQN